MKQSQSATTSAILQSGRNCWTIANVRASGLLIDAESYYRAFYEAARQARRYILIAGWRFNSDVRLLRGKDAERAGTEAKFLPFLNRLCDENPQLRVYILAWDFSIIFVREWELFQERKFQSAPHRRLLFHFDSQHPAGASHHQKFVVIDGQVGFVGGLDFNADDWDDRRHLAENPLRADSGNPPHEPYHDVQAYVVGPAAKELARYFQTRWRLAGAGTLRLGTAPRQTWIVKRPTLSLPFRRVALSRNVAPTDSKPAEVHQIRELYVDAIHAADELIYIENQYFSSHAVQQALLERMRAVGRPRLEIVIVLPKRFPSWVEAATVGPPRLTYLDELRAVAEETGHRFGAYSNVAADSGKEVPVIVHSKVLIVDDRFMTVGSCNTSNRSMGLDTELNVAWESRAKAPAIRRARVSLLAEHCGVLGELEARRRLARSAGLVEHLDDLADQRSCRLRRLTRDTLLEDHQWVAYLERWGLSFDPSKPLMEEMYDALLPG